MTIDITKNYRTRGGRKATNGRCTDYPTYLYAFDVDGTRITFTRDGERIKNCRNELDLVSEWIDEPEKTSMIFLTFSYCFVSIIILGAVSLAVYSGEGREGFITLFGLLGFILFVVCSGTILESWGAL